MSKPKHPLNEKWYKGNKLKNIYLVINNLFVKVLKFLIHLRFNFIKQTCFKPMINIKFSDFYSLVCPLFTFFIISSLFSINLFAQENNNITTNTSEILTGKLNNGLTYYIKNNKDVSERVIYSLIIKSGSLNEDESQRGLAHFNEHLSFEGTSTFPTNLIDGAFIPNLDKQKFYINAVTSQTETIYSLYLQDNREMLADTALTLFRDWIYDDFSSKESIAKQGGIIAKEWLDFQNLSEELRQGWFPTYYNNTKWAFRAPIGLIDIINKADVEDITRYRKEWYRADISAIIVVGDIKPTAILKKLEQLFKEPDYNKTNKCSEVINIPDKFKREYLVLTNPKQTMSFISFYNRVENPNLNTPEGIKSSIMYGMINTMMSQRLNDAKNKNSQVVSSLSAAMFNFIKPDWIYSPNAIFTNGKLSEAMSVIIREQERIAQNGFLESEYKSALNSVLAQYKYLQQNGKMQSNAEWSSEFESNFLNNTPYMLPAERANLYLPIIESITLEDMNTLHSKIWSEKNSLAVVVVPEKDYATAPKQEELAKIAQEVKNEKLEPYKEIEITNPLFGDTKFNNSGEILSKERISELPVYKYKLSNGAEVVYYKDSTKSGSIVMEAVSKGGKSLMLNGSDKYVELACKLVNEGPVGEYSLFNFQRLFTGSSMTISIANDTESIKGDATTEQFETLLQRIYYLFNNFNMSENRYLAQFNNNKEGYLSAGADVNRELNSLANSKLYASNPSKITLDPSLDLMESIIKERFSTLSDFTFYFTGALDEVELDSLITKYLSGGKKIKREKWSNRYEVKLKGEQSFVFNEGEGSKVMAKYIVGAPCVLDMNNISLLQATNAIVQQRLFAKIREELHLVYNISSSLKLSISPNMRADFEIIFNSEVGDVESICNEINRVFEEVVANGVSQEEISNITKMMAISKRHFESDNSFRLGCIRSHDQYLNNDYTQQINNIKYIETINSDSLQNLLGKLLRSKKYLKASFALESNM